jgi:uncharacterized caspase-like protein
LRIVSIFAFILMALLSHNVLAQKRIALVIGNGAYEHTTQLANPRNSANAVSKKLKELGFKVYKGIDKSIGQMAALIDKFSHDAKDADVAFLYYAGYGMQLNNVNYMVPINARLRNEEDIDFDLLGINYIKKQMEANSNRNRMNIMIFDTSSDNILTTKLAKKMKLSKSRVASLGLVDVGKNAFVALTSNPGEKSKDGAGEFSPFVEAFLTHIRTPSIGLEALMKKVRNDMSKNGHNFWRNSSLMSDFTFTP